MRSSSSLGNPDSESSSWIDTMVSGNRYSCTATISLACFVLSSPIHSSFNYFVFWFHILASPYILIFTKFSLDLIYMSVLQHIQGIGGNPVIKCDSVYKYKPIVYHIVESLQPHCRGLYGSVLVSKEEQNVQSRRCVRRGFMTFVFFVNKQVVSF